MKSRAITIILLCLSLDVAAKECCLDKEVYASIFTSQTSLNDVEGDGFSNVASIPHGQAVGLGVGFKVLMPNKSARFAGEFSVQKSQHQGEYLTGQPATTDYLEFDFLLKLYFRPLTRLQPYAGFGYGSSWLKTKSDNNLVGDQKLFGDHIFLNGGLTFYLHKRLQLGAEGILSGTFLLNETVDDFYFSGDLNLKAYINYSFPL